MACEVAEPTARGKNSGSSGENIDLPDFFLQDTNSWPGFGGGAAGLSLAPQVKHTRGTYVGNLQLPALIFPPILPDRLEQAPAWRVAVSFVLSAAVFRRTPTLRNIRSLEFGCVPSLTIHIRFAPL